MPKDTKFLSQRAQSHLIESARVKRLIAGAAADFFAAPHAAPAANPAPIRTREPEGSAGGLVGEIVAAAILIADTFRGGGKLLLCGNGGSAADCQHMATELTSRLTRDFDRPALPAIALTTDTSFLTAYANDVDFEGVFSRQIEALGKPGDALVAISTSGGSPNVLRAVEAARAAKIRTVGLTARGARLAVMADVAVAVPAKNTHHIQEAHLAIEHVICDLVEQILFAHDPQPPVAEAISESEAV